MSQQAEIAYRLIRDQLMAGTMEPGTRLVESQWAEKLQVNRGDIRQALSRLLAEGTVARGEKGGYFSRTYTPEDVQQIIEVRLILETAAVKLATERATPEELALLDEVCDHMELMAANTYELGFAEADVRFHQLLMEATHNPELLNTYLHANIPIAATKFRTGIELKAKLESNAREHRQIVQAIRDGEPEIAVELLTRGLKPRQIHS